MLILNPKKHPKELSGRKLAEKIDDLAKKMDIDLSKPIDAETQYNLKNLNLSEEIVKMRQK
jgi:hypothetical protein